MDHDATVVIYNKFSGLQHYSRWSHKRARMIPANSPPSLLFGPQMCLWWRKRDLKFPPLRLLPFKFKSTFWNSDFFVHCLKWRGPSADGCILPEEQLTGWNRFNPVETDNFKFGKTCRNLFSRGSKFSWMQLLGTIKCLLPLSQSFSLSLTLFLSPLSFWLSFKF